MHPFYNTVYGIAAFQAAYIGGVLYAIQEFAFFRHSLHLVILWAMLRAIANKLIGKALEKHSAVFRSLPPSSQCSLVTSANQFANVISWTSVGLSFAAYAAFNIVNIDLQTIYHLKQFCAFASAIDLCVDLYRHVGWETCLRHGVAVLALGISFEVVPSSLSDTGVLLYAMQNCCDRGLHLLFFWATMREQQIALMVKDKAKDTTTKNGASLDCFIPQDAELKSQFSYAFVGYLFGFRVVMLGAVVAYLWSGWNVIPWGWRVTHLVLPLLCGISDRKLFMYIYQNSSLAVTVAGAVSRY